MSNFYTSTLELINEFGNEKNQVYLKKGKQNIYFKKVDEILEIDLSNMPVYRIVLYRQDYFDDNKFCVISYRTTRESKARRFAVRLDGDILYSPLNIKNLINKNRNIEKKLVDFINLDLQYLLVSKSRELIKEKNSKIYNIQKIKEDNILKFEDDLLFKFAKIFEKINNDVLQGESYPIECESYIINEKTRRLESKINAYLKPTGLKFAVVPSWQSDEVYEHFVEPLYIIRNKSGFQFKGKYFNEYVDSKNEKIENKIEKIADVIKVPYSMDKSNNRFHFIKSEYCLENDWVFDFVDSLENYVKEEKPKMLIKK